MPARRTPPAAMLPRTVAGAAPAPRARRDRGRGTARRRWHRSRGSAARSAPGTRTPPHSTRPATSGPCRRRRAISSSGHATIISARPSVRCACQLSGNSSTTLRNIGSWRHDSANTTGSASARHPNGLTSDTAAPAPISSANSRACRSRPVVGSAARRDDDRIECVGPGHGESDPPGQVHVRPHQRERDEREPDAPAAVAPRLEDQDLEREQHAGEDLGTDLGTQPEHERGPRHDHERGETARPHDARSERQARPNVATAARPRNANNPHTPRPDHSGQTSARNPHDVVCWGSPKPAHVHSLVVGTASCAQVARPTTSNCHRSVSWIRYDTDSSTLTTAASAAARNAGWVGGVSGGAMSGVARADASDRAPRRGRSDFMGRRY